VITRLGRRFFYLKLTRLDHIGLHKNIEGIGDVHLTDTNGFQRGCQVFPATGSRSDFVSIFKDPTAAGGIQEIVNTTGVFHDGEHDIAVIGKKAVTGGYSKFVIVCPRSTRRKFFSDFMGIEADKVTHLFSLNINDSEDPAFTHLERPGTCRRDFDRFEQFTFHGLASRMGIYLLDGLEQRL